MNLPEDGNQLPKAGFDWIALKVIFQGRKGLNLPLFSNFDTYCPFIQNLFSNFFSSAVPSGSGAFQMPTCPSSSASASVSASASTLRGGRANLRNASVTFSLFLHEASLGWHYQHIIRRIWLNRYKGCFLKVKRSKLCPFSTLEHFLKNWSVTFSLFWHEPSQGWY